MWILILSIVVIAAAIIYSYLAEKCHHAWKHRCNHEFRNEMIICFVCTKCNQQKTETIILS